MKIRIFKKMFFAFVSAGLMTLFNGSFLQAVDEPQTVLKKAMKIRGGEGFESAAPIEFNRDYKLNHHQKMGHYDYFFVRLEPDSVLSLEARTYEKGISWNNGRRVTTTEPFAGLKLFDAKKMPLQTLEINGKAETLEKISFRNRSPRAAPLYIAVGTDKGSMHKDQAIFKMTISPFVHGDLGSEADAGPGHKQALEIEPARYYPVNSIGGGDARDVYAFEADKKEWYSVMVRGEDPIPAGIKVTVSGPGTLKKGKKPKEIISYESGGMEQVVTKSFEIPKEGLYYVEIDLAGPVSEKSLYSIELEKVSGPFRGR